MGESTEPDSPIDGTVTSSGNTVAACLLFLVWFWFRLVVFGMEKRKKEIGGEEVDILHKMDNRCVFWSLCVLLKKKIIEL